MISTSFVEEDYDLEDEFGDCRISYDHIGGDLGEFVEEHDDTEEHFGDSGEESEILGGDFGDFVREDYRVF